MTIAVQKTVSMDQAENIWRLRQLGELDGGGALPGAVSVSGDSSDNDQIYAVAGEAAGLKANAG